MVVKPFVGTDEQVSDPCRNLGKAGLQKIQGTTGGVNISSTQLPMPEVLGLSFETEQGMIGWPSMLDRVVTDPCLFLCSIDHKDCRIQVEDQARRRMGHDSHLDQKPIVETAQLWQGLGCHAEQEPPEGSGIGVSRQPAEIPKDAVGLQEIGGLDSFQAKDHRIKDREHQLANAVAVVALIQTDICGDRVLEANSSQKTMKQIDAAKMRETLSSEGDGEFSGPLRHSGETLPIR